MQEIIKTKQFLKETFAKSTCFKSDYDREYRLEHSFRVAKIGEEIAKNEGMDVTAVVLGCLLHDIGYCILKANDDYNEHGRVSAVLARPFLESLKIKRELIEEICYGIAIHVDDKSDFPGEGTKLALTIGDADNIDRFDIYRIYETLLWNNFKDMNLMSKTAFVAEMLNKLEKYKQLDFGSKTSKEFWLEKLNFQIIFYSKLKKQLLNSN